MTKTSKHPPYVYIRSTQVNWTPPLDNNMFHRLADSIFFFFLYSKRWKLKARRTRSNAHTSSQLPHSLSVTFSLVFIYFINICLSVYRSILLISCLPVGYYTRVEKYEWQELSYQSMGDLLCLSGTVRIVGYIILSWRLSTSLPCPLTSRFSCSVIPGSVLSHPGRPQVSYSTVIGNPAYLYDYRSKDTILWGGTTGTNRGTRET